MVNIRVGATLLPPPLVRVQSKIPFHVLVHFFLQVYTAGTSPPGYARRT
jgi:hypothetical protein